MDKPESIVLPNEISIHKSETVRLRRKNQEGQQT